MTLLFDSMIVMATTKNKARMTQVSSSASGRTGCYLNVPPPRDAGVGGRDLPNHDHKGSAFELYKKPPDPRGPPGGHPNLPAYSDHGNR